MTCAQRRLGWAGGLMVALFGMGSAVAQSPVPTPTVVDRSALFQGELDRLQAGIPFARLVLLNTAEPSFRAYASVGLLHVDDAALEHLQSGLASVAVENSRVNGRLEPVCYVLYRPDQARHIELNFIAPIARLANAQQAAAFLMGHEVGHCLDQFERATTLEQDHSWASSDVGALGLAPAAAERLFGDRLTSAAYVEHKTELYKDKAQRQYEERVADAFGLAWVWRLGGSERVRAVILRARSGAHPWDTHDTGPILDALEQAKAAVATTQSVQDVWALARRLQLATGVDPSLGPGSTRALNPLAHWLKPSDALAPTAAPTPPAVDTPGLGQPFQDQPRFGAEPHFGADER